MTGLLQFSGLPGSLPSTGAAVRMWSLPGGMGVVVQSFEQSSSDVLVAVI
jgi:hypothetical protein